MAGIDHVTRILASDWSSGGLGLWTVKQDCKPGHESRIEKSLDIKVNLSYLMEHLPCIYLHDMCLEIRARGRHLLPASDFKLNSLIL